MQVCVQLNSNFSNPCIVPQKAFFPPELVNSVLGRCSTVSAGAYELPRPTSLQSQLHPLALASSARKGKRKGSMSGVESATSSHLLSSL